MRVRPSEYFFIHDELAAWSFDRAVVRFGMAVEADLESIEDKNPKKQAQKRQARLDKWLGAERKFRDPAAR
jgi:hypothetical protein